MRQLEHSEIVNQKHKKNIVIICDRVDDKRNMGMVFRLADAFGVNEIIFYGEEKLKVDGKIRKVSRSSSDIIKYQQVQSLSELTAWIKNENFELIILDKCDASKALSSINWTNRTNVALVIGHERNGVSQEIMDLSEVAVHIPMYGRNSSMNVVNALAIGLYELTRQA